MDNWQEFGVLALIVASIALGVSPVLIWRVARNTPVAVLSLAVALVFITLAARVPPPTDQGDAARVFLLALGVLFHVVTLYWCAIRAERKHQREEAEHARNSGDARGPG